MELVVIISVAALIVAIPSCIADSLLLIEKFRAHKNEDSSQLPLDSFKKVVGNGLDHAQRLASFKKAILFHLQNSVRITGFAIFFLALFVLYPIYSEYERHRNERTKQLGHKLAAAVVKSLK